jgi:pimeloyl-ACP methyl ester carboxylesterase
MQQVIVADITLEYETIGTGEPVVLIHGALIADAFLPLLAEPVLANRYRFLHYHRRGYQGSSRGPGPVSIAQQAVDCRALLREAGVPRAHVVGHSFGASIALQLALDAPDAVHSLTLLEPALVVGDSGQSYRDAMTRNRQRYTAGDVAGTVDDFLRIRFGSAYRSAFLDRVLPGAFAQATADAGTAFEVDMPAVGEWRFTEAEAGRILQPALLVLGSES